MRGILSLILFASIAMSLGNCDFYSGTSVTTQFEIIDGLHYVEGVLVTGDAEVAEIDILDYVQGPYLFDYTIDEINIDVLFSTITVHYTIVENQYYYFEFYSQMRFADGQGKSVNHKHYQEVSEESYTLVYPWIGGTETYRFLLAKYPRLSGVDQEIIDNATAGFTLRISSYNDRKHLGESGIRFDDEGSEQTSYPYTQSGRTILSGRFAFFDSDLAVTTATVVLYEVGTDRLIYTNTFDVGTERDKDGKFIHSGWVVNGLSPGVTYRADLLVSGHDGIDPFVDRLLISRNIETDRFWGTVDSTHGMYAYQIPGHLNDRGYHFQIFLANDGMTHSADSNDPIEFILRIRDEHGIILHEEQIDELGFTSYNFDNLFLGIDHVVSVESKAGDIILCRDIIPFVATMVDVYYRDFTVPQSVSISWNQNHGTLIYAWCEITQGDNVLLRYNLSLESELGSVILTLSGIEFYGPQLMVRIVYEYTAFGGHDTVIIDDTTPA